MSHHAQPEVPPPLWKQVLDSSAHHLRSPDASILQTVFRPGSRGSSQPEPTAQQLDAVYDCASGLCDDGNFRLAAALALHLVTFKPGEPRYSFIAGTCMQRLGAHAHAAQMYGFTLLSGGDHAATLYRFGECMLALGDKENAEKALDAAFELARDEDETQEVQGMCEALIAAMRKPR